MKKTLQETPLFRPTWATVDLSALKYNYSVIKNHLPPKIKIMAMVKADAYGHGAVAVSRELENDGVRALGVATVEEGIELRDAGISTEILVMGGLMGAGSPASEKMIESDLTPVIHSSVALESLENDAAHFGKKVGVHLKVDTGMSRLGVRPESLNHILEKIKYCKHLFVEGVMTHLAEGDNEEISSRQMKLFLESRRIIEEELGKIKIWHIANSAAALRGEPVLIPDAEEVWVRPGLVLYGSSNGFKFGENLLKPVMGLVSQIVLLKTVPEGSRVSYGGAFTTKRPSRLAIVPIGYADGYPWSVSGRAKVLVCGQKVPVGGRVKMELFVFVVTAVKELKVGDEVTLLGSQGNEKVELSEIAKWAGTITYEILCGISKRMPRTYK
jgi:alanine racemase